MSSLRWNKAPQYRRDGHGVSTVSAPRATRLGHGTKDPKLSAESSPPKSEKNYIEPRNVSTWRGFGIYGLFTSQILYCTRNIFALTIECQSYVSITLKLNQAIITGGASGIGAACARELVSSNALWKVIIGDKNVEGGQSVAKALGKDVIFVECDVRRYDDLVKLFNSAIENFGRIDFGTRSIAQN